MKVFKNVNVIEQSSISKAIVVADKGKIIGIHNNLDITPKMEVIDGKGLYLSPGFVDIHVHGGGGYGVMGCKPDEIIKMCAAHAKYGTTSILPTTLASPIALLMKAIDAVREAQAECKQSNILGIHLEGPFLSHEMMGAQSPDSLLVPDEQDYSELLDYWDGIRIVGASPEIPGALEFGKEVARRGIVASVAHSNAVYDKAIEALDYGYSDVTHIYSACSTVKKVGAFRVAGVVEAGLVDDRYTVQVIADMRHLPVGLLKLIYKCKGAERTALVSDGLEFAAMELEEGAVCMQGNGVAVVHEDGVMKLADKSRLAGSVATCNTLVRNMYKHAEVSLIDSVKMASQTPAEIIGFGDTKGKISVGYDSDIVLFDKDINVKFVMVGDNIVNKQI